MKYKVWGKAKIMLKPPKQHIEKISIALFLMALLITGIIVVRLAMLYADSIYSGEREPYLQLLSSNGVTIRWQSDERSKAAVVISKTLDAKGPRFEERFAKELHSINLTGLEADTVYYYRLYHDNNIFRSGAEYWFRTRADKPAKKTLHLLVTAGQLDQPFNAAETDLDLILNTGHHLETASNSDYQEHVFSPLTKLLKNASYHPLYSESDAKGWSFFKLFDLPKEAELGGVKSESERYYSVDFGSAHIIFLDSIDGGYTSKGTMLNWLKEDLKQNKQAWLIAVMHNPVYVSEKNRQYFDQDAVNRSYNMRKRVLKLLAEADVDLVLAGHVKEYERSDLTACLTDSGLTETDIKNRGERYTKAEGRETYQGAVFVSLADSNETDAYLMLEIKQHLLSARYVTTDSNLLDQFSINKVAMRNMQVTECF